MTWRPTWQRRGKQDSGEEGGDVTEAYLLHMHIYLRGRLSSHSAYAAIVCASSARLHNGLPHPTFIKALTLPRMTSVGPSSRTH